MKKIIFSALAALALTTAAAQDLRSAYFLGGNTFGHNLNPAFAPERGYLTLPVLPGNLSVSVGSNFGADMLIFPYNQNGYRNTTFLSPTVSVADFESGLNDKNRVSVNLRYNIMGTGFRAWGGYNTIDVALRAQAAANVPGDLLRLAKSGMTSAEGTTYDLSGLRATAMSFAEIAFGHSREVVPGRLRLGAKAKVLLGVGRADIDVEDATVVMSQSAWRVTTNGTARMAFKGTELKLKNVNNGIGEIDEIDIDGGGISGFGLGFDLGASYNASHLVDGLTLSAALLDLGFISWSNGYDATTKDEFDFAGFKQPIPTDNHDSDPNAIKNQWKQIEDDFEGLYRLTSDGQKKSYTTGLGATLNIGAAYTLPSHPKLTMGLLSSTFIKGAYSTTELRLSANYALARAIDTSLSYGLGTYGGSMGWVINLKPSGFNFFLAGEHNFAKFNPQGIPTKSALHSINLGMNITLGKKTEKTRFVY